MASSKRQTTMAKLNRERRVQEKRELKREKKEAAKLAKLTEAEGGVPMLDEFGEPMLDEFGEPIMAHGEATEDGAEATDEDPAASPA
jgi:translation initiation factor 2 alpha subunit (eIF-2alpha)